MPSDSSASARTSIISLDPTVVSHITNPTSSTKPTHARAGSSPGKTRGSSIVGHSKGHSRANSVPSKNHVKRSASLRRAKNSTEMLRQRPRRIDDDRHVDIADDPKGGRNFSVTNVGTGGMLYLRPLGHAKTPSQTFTNVSTGPLSAPLPAPVSTAVPTEGNETQTQSVSMRKPRRLPSSRTRSVSPKRLLERVTKSKESGLAQRPGHTRSQSFSTLDESRRSLTGGWPKTLRIVINRHEPAPATSPPTGAEVKPALEIPIPHYRLGVPRFSSHGTPMLRNSTFSRASSTSSIKRASTVKQEPASSAPPPASLKAFAKIQNHDVPTEIQSTANEHMQHHRRSFREDPHRESKSVSVGYAPSIYDELNEVYNDSSVVRFAHDVRDVTAATPARIIAQISSESFMDYELVSDFFLTFRSYMSTIDVLDLLLARLAWAIGRMSDDGRIIRIRTFAALRHWILNYFMDDFVPHRHLRIRFCEEVNDLYTDVQSRQFGGTSDLKILQDLKRCWNGRCSLYWDGEQFNMDSNQDADLVPGGVLGSRNPIYTNIREVRPSPSQIQLLASQSAPPQHAEFPGEVKSPTTQRHRHQLSYASSGPAESLESEQSIQPNSCSIPLPMTTKAADGSTRLRKPQPANVQERRFKAPSDLKVVTTRSNSKSQQHRRGGNSFDSTRERTPLTAPPPPSAVPLPDPYDGSVIRGFVYAPIEPFVHIPSQMPLSPTGPVELTRSPVITQSVGASSPPAGPAVKNVFGSIRRALGGKQGTGEMTLIAISNPQNHDTVQHKRSQVPLNVSRSTDEVRQKSSAIPASPVRIDLLCAAAIESYQATAAVPDGAESGYERRGENQNSILPPGGFGSLAPRIHDMSRVQSHITAQSGSILIVDGTALGEAIMSGAVTAPHSHRSARSERSHSTALPHDARHPSYDTNIAFQDEDDVPMQSHPRSGAVDNVQALPEIGSPDVKSAVLSQPKSNLSLKDSSNPTAVKHRKSVADNVASADPKAAADGPTVAPTPPLEEREGTPDSEMKHPAQTLRRRPGGDLRKNQNVHDLESLAPHHESLDSLADTVSSRNESLLTMSHAPQAPTYGIIKDEVLTKEGIRRVSMINTHSSQHLRPSFEAAVAGFSAIPDDDDGGLEATLLKLEGRYEKKSPSINASPSTVPTETFSVASTQPAKGNSSPLTSRSNASQGKFSPAPSARRITTEAYPAHPPPPKFAHKQAVFGLPTESDAESEGSEGSFPLVQRTSAVPTRSDHPKSQEQRTARMSTVTSPYAADRGAGYDSPADGLGIRSMRYSQDLIRPGTVHTEQSFLLDEDEQLSDLSSEMSVDIINYSEAMGSASSPLLVAPGTAISGLEIPSHPLAHSSFVNLPMQSDLALDGNPASGMHPLTPEPSPTLRRSKHPDPRRDTIAALKEKPSRSPITVGPAHIPFILACDSQVLAQQLTLIEQSALTEIEWADLVNMRWSNQPANILDWAEYITKPEIKGVDVVITRFNLMVKWSLSEIVLTQNIHERVRVVSKLIHVAAHARRLRNYATMLQLTIALTSSDCTRLVQTWQLVSDPDKSLLKNMESLIQPIRNFNDLRVEMESADLTDGCIPFIGLYVHDLTYNSQKPAQIDAGKNRQPLINFERFRTTAIIVKGLLRLIDASSRYEFDPVHGVIERCLWIASLEEERIRNLSKTLEATT